MGNEENCGIPCLMAATLSATSPSHKLCKLKALGYRRTQKIGNLTKGTVSKARFQEGRVH